MSRTRRPLRRAHRILRKQQVRTAVPGQYYLFRGIHQTMRGLARASHAIDDRLHPSWRDTPIGDPLFIIACPRSGTTLLHRLMSLDRERFTSLSLYQTLLPGITATRTIEALRHSVLPDDGPLSRAISLIEDRLFGRWDHIHRVSFSDAEEDEWFWMNAGYSPGWYFFFPEPGALPEQAFAETLDPDTLARLSREYEDALRRHMHAEGRARTLLLKNVLLAGRLDIVRSVAPGARYIQLVRDPYRSVPSLISMFYNVIRVMTPGVPPDGELTRQLCHIGCTYYRRMDEFVRSLPHERALTLRYDDLIASPRAAVTRAYTHFDLPLSDPFRDRLDRATRAQKKHVSTHEYSLDMFGLTPADIHEPLADIFDRYGFERRTS